MNLYDMKLLLSCAPQMFRRNFFAERIIQRAMRKEWPDITIPVPRGDGDCQTLASLIAPDNVPA